MKTPIPHIDDDLPGWDAQRDALRQLHREVLDEPVPPGLLAAAGLVAGQHARQARWMRWGGMAAGVVVAFAAGWLANNQWVSQTGSSIARGPATREFVRAAAVAHAVY